MVIGRGSEWFLKYLELKELDGPGHASGSALESCISNFNFIANLYININHIKKIRTIPSVVSEISSGQIFAVSGTPVGQP